MDRELKMAVMTNGIVQERMCNPYSLPAADIPSFYNDGPNRFRCQCGFQYELRRGDNGLIPVGRMSPGMHSDTCPLSSRYLKANRAVRYCPDTDSYSVSVSADLSCPPARTGRKQQQTSSETDSVASRITPDGLVRWLNYMALFKEAGRKQADSLDRKNDYSRYYLSDNFSSHVYACARSVEIPGLEKPVGVSSLRKDGYDFFYREVKGVSVIYHSPDGEKLEKVFTGRFSLDSLIDLAGDEAKAAKTLFIRILFRKEGAWPVRVSFPALKEALRHLNICFTVGEADFSEDGWTAAGWRYPDRDRNGNIKRNAAGRPFPVIERLSLFRANRYGVYVRSLPELRLSEYLMKKCNLSPVLSCYKPFMPSLGYYKGKWMPLWVVRGRDRELVVEIFNSGRSGEYLDKVSLQDTAAHNYLTWFPSQESFEAFCSRLDPFLSLFYSTYA